MLDQMFNTNKYHTRGALEIAQRIRDREAQRWLLQAEYGAQVKVARKSTRKGLVALFAGLFDLPL